jgi:hypothetical protein
MFLLFGMTYTDLITTSQDVCRDPAVDRVEALAGLVALYCVLSGIHVRDFDFDRYFLILEAM